MIKLDEQFKLKIITFWCNRDAFRVVLRATPCALARLFRLLFVLLRRLCFLLIGDLGRLPVLFVEEMRLRRNSGLCQHLAQSDLVVELQRTAFALHTAAVDAGDQRTASYRHI